MALLEQLESDVKTAMKEGAAARVAVLRLLVASLKNERIKLGHDLTNDEAIKVLQREAKQRKDSIEAYTNGGRSELAQAEQAELEIIDSYLPQQLSEAELAQLVDQAIKDLNVTGIDQIGIVIGAVMKLAAGKADGGRVSALVRAKLQK